MAVFVTGASGFLGGRLVHMLAERGEDVRILDRGASDLRHLAGLPIQIVRGDLSNAGMLASSIAGVTTIFHCAACSTDWAPRQTYLDANVTGTANLLAAAEQAPELRRFVHVSTTDVYGYPLVPCAEDAPIVDAGLPYNQTKGRAEQLAWEAHSRGLPLTVVRPATIYGPRGKDFTQEVATLLRQRVMATIDRGSAPGGFIYVDNVVDAMLAAAASERTLGQAYNLSDGTGATWHEYLQLFAAELKLPMPWIDLSFANATRLAGVFESIHRTLRLGGRPLLTKHAVLLLGRSQEFPAAKARAEFSFIPQVSLPEGIARSATWLRSL